MNLRASAGTALAQTGLAQTRARWLQRRNRETVRILAYHRVLPPDEGYCLDPGVISATPESFRRQLQFVRQYFTPITFSEFHRIIGGQTAPPLNPVLITFDDGYRDHYSIACPILRELKIPATLFVVTRHVGTAQMFWWDRIAFLIHATQQRTCRIDLGNGERQWSLSNERQRATFRQAVLQAVKSVSEEQKTGILAGLGERLQLAEESCTQSRTGVSPVSMMTDGMDEDRRDACPTFSRDFPDYAQQLLTWEQVREMSRNGIEIGSHTRTHPILTRISAERLCEEIEGSRDDILRELGTAPTALAYPAGRSGRYNRQVIEAVQKAGYSFGVAYDHGLNRLADFDPFQVRRIAVEADHGFDQFVARLVFPNLAA